MKIRPYITFDGECNEAIELYKRAFKTDSLQVLRFSDLPPNPAFAISEELKNRIMQATLKFSDNFSVCPTEARSNRSTHPNRSE